MVEIDALDSKIIFELDRNSRAAYSQIGKAVRASKETVKYRVGKLVERGIIGGFYSVIDFSKLGFISFRLYLTLQDASPQKRDALIAYLMKNPNIWILYRITGKYNVSFSIWVRNPWEYERFWHDLLEKFGENIMDQHLAMKTSYTEFTRNYLIKEKRSKEEFIVLQKAKTESLDRFDLGILQLLSLDARISLVEMAEKLKTSPVTCSAHLKKLLKQKVIIGFRTMFNYEKLGYQYYKVDLWFKNMRKRREIMQFVLSHPNVIYTENTLVTSHFEFDLEVQNFGEFIRIMDGFEAAFPDDIRRYEYYTLVKNYKISYLPAIR